ncbi:hypothetical protein DH2020_038951 [Rehmannia glutinosa]|uniref:RNase H type-1 domain-containing protein n=1 Tax=Rehmannia glutinosa TaxID=99300 RepID=A0ABR0UXS3_REHGL
MSSLVSKGKEVVGTGGSSEGVGVTPPGGDGITIPGAEATPPGGGDGVTISGVPSTPVTMRMPVANLEALFAAESVQARATTRVDRSHDRRDSELPRANMAILGQAAPSRGTIHMIVGGPTDGDSNRAKGIRPEVRESIGKCPGGENVTLRRWKEGEQRKSKRKVGGNYDIKEDRMRRYVGVVAELVEKFDKFELLQVPRGENTKADHLSKVASSAQESESRNITVRQTDRKHRARSRNRRGDDWRARSPQILKQERPTGRIRGRRAVKSKSRVISASGGTQSELLREALDQVEEMREQAYLKMEASKSLLKATHDGESKKEEFQCGRPGFKASGRGSKQVGKLEANREGPYKVTKVIAKGAYELEDMKGLNKLKPRVAELTRHHLRSLGSPNLRGLNKLKPRVAELTHHLSPEEALISGLNKLKPPSGRAQLVPPRVPPPGSRYPKVKQGQTRMAELAQTISVP